MFTSVLYRCSWGPAWRSRAGRAIGNELGQLAGALTLVGADYMPVAGDAADYTHSDNAEVRIDSLFAQV